MTHCVDLEELEAIAQAATPAPWSYTEHCGAQVAAGLIHDQEPGGVRLKKGGFFLFEIEPDVYDRGDDASDQDEYEARAQADVKLIACMRNALPDLITELREQRALPEPEPEWEPLHSEDGTLQCDEGNAYLFGLYTSGGWFCFQDVIVWDSESSPRWADGDSGWEIDDVTHFRPLPAEPTKESKP